MSNKQSNIMDKNIVIIDAEIYTTVQYDLDNLTELFEDVISDLHRVKGGQQLRHSYIFYRDRIDAIKDKLRKGRSNGTN